MRPDFLSRYINLLSMSEDKKIEDKIMYLNFVTEEIKLISANLISKETDRDRVLSKVKEYTLYVWPKKVPKTLIPFLRKSNELYIKKGCVVWGYRIFVPEIFKEELLKELHCPHMGIIRMKSISRAHIESIRKKCSACLENSSNPSRATLHPWNWPVKFGQNF